FGISENDVQGARVGRQVAPEEAPWLEQHAPQPFEAGPLHPARRAPVLARKKIEETARGLDEADIRKPVGIVAYEFLLQRHTQAQPQYVRSEPVYLHKLCIQRGAGQVAVAVADDLEPRIGGAHGSDRPVVL